MLKPKSLINIFWIMTILFLCHSIDPSTVFAFNYPNGNENVIVDTCPPENSGQSSGGVSTVSGDHNYPPDWSCPEDIFLEYDTANSQETIARNGSANLVVIGNYGPYTWSVSGQGFWFDANHTIKTLENNGLTATLYADDTACGAATITISGSAIITETGECNVPPVEGYVRCTTGGWGPQQTGCFLSGTPDSEACGGYQNYRCTYTKVEGKYRQVQQVAADQYCYNSDRRTQCLDYDCGHILQNNNWQNCEPFTCCWQGGTTHQFCLFNYFIYYQEWECP
jgi:hypothetical protein